MGTGDVDGDLIGVIRDRLEVALRDRDVVVVSALRSALAAISNAEAVPPDRMPAAPGGLRIAGALAGLGAGEAVRRSLTGAEVAGIVGAEITERRVAAAAYQRGGHCERAERLLREAHVLQAALSAATAANTATEEAARRGAEGVEVAAGGPGPAGHVSRLGLVPGHPGMTTQG